jgi:hypothetical protein
VPSPQPAPAVASPAEPPVDPARAEPEWFTIVVLPDTQFYSSTYPDVFDSQTRWIVANRQSERIAVVLHEGDVVNYDERIQWERAARALRRLDGHVPYALVPGNHDLGGGTSRNGSLMNVYFPPAEFLKYPWFRETFEPGDIDNSVLLIDVNGQSWLVLALEFGPRDRVLAWAGSVLERHPKTPAIVVTHAYLYGDGTRYDHRRADQLYNPKHFILEEGANDGEEMWHKLVSRHDNVRFVLSGHHPGAARLTSARPSGTKVHQILANYQTCAGDCFEKDGRPSHGGNGWLRLMRFEPAAGKVSVRTYSPYLGEWKTDPANQFELPLD